MLDTFKLAVLSLALIVASCASAPSPGPVVQVPDKLKPGAKESLATIVTAKGVQIYACRAGKDGSGNYAWAFVAPEAKLFDAGGNQVGRHYAGPTWESADGSMIVGTLRERADAPAADAIPWLLLSAKSAGAEGAFSRVTSVQRVSTAGGVAPAVGCSQLTAGTLAHISYSAEYRFYTGG